LKARGADAARKEIDALVQTLREKLEEAGEDVELSGTVTLTKRS
jgi:hypothetical protein